jgi:hypothetical protein
VTKNAPQDLLDMLNTIFAGENLDPCAYDAVLRETRLPKSGCDIEFVAAVRDALVTKREGAMEASGAPTVKTTKSAPLNDTTPGEKPHLSLATAEGHSEAIMVSSAEQVGAPTAHHTPKTIKTDDTEVEVLDFGPPGPPPWQDPEIVGPLLESGDEREILLVECLIRRQYEMFEHLRGAVRRRDADDAVREFRGAEHLCRAVIKTAENLTEHRYGGIQHITVLELSGPTLGLGAKVQQLTQPQPGSPEALLIERLYHCESCFENAATLFGKNASFEVNRIAEYGNLQKPSRWFRDAERWDTLRGKALKLMAALSAALNKLERGHRQVVIKKHESLNPDRPSTDRPSTERPNIEEQNPERRNAERRNTERTNTKTETVRDHDGQRDSAPSGENAKPRKRIPLVN